MFEVKLDTFEGPLDLLLHLIKKHELSIFDIPIHFITERFLEAIAEMELLDLQVGGEFLVMAATLAHIKSRLLLPRGGTTDDEEDENVDPREELVRQLVEYQRYRELARKLGEQAQLGCSVFVRPISPPEVRGAVSSAEGNELDLFQLLDAFEQVRSRVGFRRGYEVVIQRRTVLQEMVRIARSLTDVDDRAGFWDLVEEQPDGAPDIASIIGVFLAILELVRMGLLRVFQAVPAGTDLALQSTVPNLLQRLRLRDELDASLFDE